MEETIEKLNKLTLREFCQQNDLQGEWNVLHGTFADEEEPFKNMITVFNSNDVEEKASDYLDDYFVVEVETQIKKTETVSGTNVMRPIGFIVVVHKREIDNNEKDDDDSICLLGDC